MLLQIYKLIFAWDLEFLVPSHFRKRNCTPHTCTLMS